MKTVLKRICLYLLLAVLPFAAFAGIGEAAKNNFHNAFNASLVDKYHRLTETKAQKIVFVGGSSLPFGLRCDLVEQELGYTAVDFGVYASLGTKVMTELSLDGIGRDDVVVLAPELNAQTYSTYFNADVLWESLNEERGMIFSLSWSEQQAMAFHYFKFLWEKLRISRSEGISEDELYARSSFNAYGDLAYPRAGNLMPNGYDPSQLVTIADLYNEDFFADLAAYVKAARQKGAEVYFAFSPTNALAVDFTVGEATAFETYIAERLGCSVLGSIAETTYESGYFYNTNFHLNDTGAVLHTVNLINFLKAELGISTPTDIEIPPLEDGEGPTDDPPAEDFPFLVETQGGTIYLTAIKEAYKNVTELRLPETYNGRPIGGVTGGFLQGCENLTVLTVPACYQVFDVGVFAGCPRLEKIYLETENTGNTFVPDSGLMEGAEGARLYIPQSKRNKFVSNYTWRNYIDWFVFY